MKNRGVSVKVSESFYRMMQGIRLNLNNKHKIKVSSDIKLTDMMARNKGLFKNKRWIQSVKKWNY